MKCCNGWEVGEVITGLKSAIAIAIQAGNAYMMRMNRNRIVKNQMYLNRYGLSENTREREMLNENESHSTSTQTSRHVHLRGAIETEIGTEAERERETEEEEEEQSWNESNVDAEEDEMGAIAEFDEMCNGCV